MRYGCFLLFFLLFFPVSVVYSRDVPDQPKLIIQLVIDHMSIDYLYRYEEVMSDQGFKKIMREGSYFRNVYHPYPVDQYAPAYVSLTTGTLPSVHGIIGDTWYTSLEEQVVNVTFDKDYHAIGGSYGTGQHAPSRLLFPAFPDYLRLHFLQDSRSYGVSLFPDAAILTSGITANGAFWYDQNKGNWMSSSYYYDSLPAFVESFNQKKIADIYLNKDWGTFYASEDYKHSLPDINPYEKGLDNQNTFPYKLEKIRKSYGYKLLTQTPYGNTYTKEMAMSVIYDEDLGRGTAPDFLSVVFSANRAVEQKFGPQSMEMQDLWARLDNEIKHFVDFLEKHFGKENFLLILSSGSGTASHVDYLKAKNIPTGYVNTRAALSLLRSYLNILYGHNDWVPFYHQKQFYLNHKEIEDQGISFEEIQRKAADFLVQISGVADVVEAENLKSASFYESRTGLYQNSYYPTRSGDLTLVLEPNWAERIASLNLYDYEQRVPLFLYGWKVPAIQVEREISVIDLVPTLYRMLNMPVPNGIEGKVIPELF